MSYEIKTTPRFDKVFKQLVKKYSSLKQEYSLLIDALALVPVQGTDLGNNTYKIRLAISSKGKGKSGGARVIPVVIHADKEVVLLYF